MMNKKMIFSYIIFVFCINSYGQFNTIMSKKIEGTPVIVQPLYGPCLYESVNDIVIDSVAIAMPDEDIEPIGKSAKVVANERVGVPPITGKVVAYNEDELFTFRQLVALPLDTCVVTSGYGDRIHPIERILRAHQGIDLKADSSYVYSVMPGKIIRVSSNRRSGNYVVVEHGSYQSIYCHLRKSYVDKGDYVNAGQIVGLSGNTGMSTGEHLHFALKQQGKYINPEPFLTFVAALIGYVDLKLSELPD